MLHESAAHKVASTKRHLLEIFFFFFFLVWLCAKCYLTWNTDRAELNIPMFSAGLLCYREQTETSAALKARREKNTWHHVRSSDISQVKSTVHRKAWQLGERGSYLYHLSRYNLLFLNPSFRKKQQQQKLYKINWGLKYKGNSVSWMENMLYCTLVSWIRSKQLSLPKSMLCKLGTTAVCIHLATYMLPTT